MVSRKPLILTLVLMLVFPVLTSCMATGQSGVESEISLAKEELLECYKTVKNVEANGGNIAGLIEILNSAAKLLTRAELAYLAKNYSLALSLAGQSRTRLSGFDAKASLVQNDALNNVNLSLYTDALLAIASFAVFCVAIAVWFALGKTRNARIVNP